MNRSVLHKELKPAVITEFTHQMEWVAERKGVAYINDSRSITIKSTVNAINTLHAKIVLLIGGEDRTVDYGFLLNAELEKVKAVIYMGKEKERLFNVMRNQNCLITSAHSIKEAVELSNMVAINGDVVLFSPACPSYEAFDNYKNRGNRFVELVNQL